MRSVGMRKQSQGERDKVGLLTRARAAQSVAADFCNKIGQIRTFWGATVVANRVIAAHLLPRDQSVTLTRHIS